MGQEIRKKLHEWIRLRLETAQQLRVIAPELEKIRSNVCIARITGSSVAAAGGVAGIVGGVLTVVTAGLAAPIVLAVAGGAAAAVGSVTSVVSQIVERVMSGNEMKAAEAAIEEDSKMTSEVQQLIEKLAEKCCHVTVDGLCTETEKISYFLFHDELEKAEVKPAAIDMFSVTVPEAVLRVTSIVLSVGGLTANVVCNGLRIASITRAAAEVGEAAVSGARTAGAAASEGAGIAADVISGAGNVASTAAKTGLTTTAKIVAGAGIVVRENCGLT
jgi:Apolipoprotein L